MAYYILKSYKLKADAFRIFQALSVARHSFFLDSSLNSGHLGRYSFLGMEPFSVFKLDAADPFGKLREAMDKYKMPVLNNGIPFLGGAVGYFGYDVGFALERKIKMRAKADLGIPDCFVGLYNTTVIIDHLKQLLYICALGFPEKNLRLAEALAKSNFKKVHRLLSRVSQEKESAGENRQNPKIITSLDSNFSKDAYLAAVKKAKDYIRRGDIYQVNLSQRFQARTKLSGPEIYRRLRQISPSYFSAYLDTGEFAILSSSPERFLKLEGRMVTTRPMKGTRPRGNSRSQDGFFKEELLKSAKDKAELTMIVDLERNDLGRVCHYDSVRVRRLRELEKYQTVFQTTASISGRLHKDKDRFDLLRACFPGGSITGCPKIRAMEIIEELEPARRSIYTGALGYLSFSGGMDFNILIRTILKKKERLYFSVGGGIVADSDPLAEYEETLVKAKAMIESIGAA
ncbi:MAG: aminodeoxychorismate synthase component I [Candidatus Omnitrophica bacterium]|nr:aminodeoxychorismate synthase component I [Candidatus Omnitrophota bacterium]